VLTVTPGCRQTVEKQVEPSTPRTEEEAESPPAETPEDIPEIHLDREAVGKIGSFEQLSPRLFIELTILYRRETERWLTTAQTLDPGLREQYLERANRVFFSTFGITEEEYLRFGERNQEELNRYLEEHPELMKDVMG